MWLCEDKAKGKTARFRLPSASQKRACLSSLLTLALTLVNREMVNKPGKFFDVDFFLAILEVDPAQKVVPCAHTTNQ